jgi:hypothetical protein
MAKSEYGKPTMARAVMAKVGIGDGYGNPKKAKQSNRMNVSNATEKLPSVLAKRKKELDSYANGGKVKKRKGC